MFNVLSSTFVGAHELRKDLTKLLDTVKKSNEPVVITSQGKPTAILTSVENYNQLQEMIDELQLAIKELTDKVYIKTLIEEKKKVKSGKGIPAEELYKETGI
ncbi:MAG TPA: type II toxin-antitoxin system Phd/YefM family antitoxin [Patescibacteria group bacterium]